MILSPFHRRKIVFVVLAALSLNGCASVFGGRRQNVKLRTNPENVAFTVFDVKTGKPIKVGMTPAMLQLKRGAGYMKGARYRIVFETEGYAERVVELVSRARGWYVTGNLLIGGALGWLVVDPLTGGMWRLNPGEVRVDFDAPGQPEQP